MAQTPAAASAPQDRLKALVTGFKPAIEASLDPICIVNSLNKIIYMSLPMKNLLGIRLRDLEQGIVFCNVLKLAVCRDHCQILDVLRTGTPLRLDESPATKGEDKLRVSLKAVALYDSGAKAGRPLGAIISLRDTTGEVLLQAKYHKLLEIVHAKDEKIEETEERLRALQKSLRGARGAVV